MGRVGHKDDCQCGICKRMRTKVEVAIPQVPEAKGVAVGTLITGSKFKYQPRRGMMVNAPVHTYIRYGTDEGMVTAEEVASGEIIHLPENTLVSRA